MPQRSNAFQKLAVIIHRALEPEWKVTESEMVPDVLTGTLREVDITAKRVVAGHVLVLSVECRDHRRASDVSWVEAMHTKHQHLPTSKLALWSRSGFTREALVKAKLLKIDAISQAQTTRPKWARLAQGLSGGFLKAVTPTLSPFVDVNLPNGGLQRFEDVTAWPFYDSDGNPVGSVAALVQQILHDEKSRTIFLDHAPVGEGNFYVEFVPPTAWYVEVPKIGRCIANRIGVGVRTLGEEAPMSAMSASQGERVVTVATAPLLNGTFELVVEETANGETNAQSIVQQEGARRNPTFKRRPDGAT